MKKAFVGLSGGVDSSVTAALLKEQGYEVTGVYMKNWSQDLPGMPCPWKEDYRDAKRVAVQLDIPFKLYDFETEYRERVVEYMVREYQTGNTPNPDIMCNQEVKFKLFLETALAEGADYIATGHYAKVEPLGVPAKHVTSKISRISSEPKTSQEYGLFTARDDNKDQTYFLYRIREDALAHTLFPLGDYTKPEVRELAKKFDLVTATKKESMGICFVGKVGIREFLQNYVDEVPGDVVDQAGSVIGRHDGAIFYTIGQRHGLELGGGLPYYVTHKDMSKNIVYVTTDLNDDRLWDDTLRLTQLHWINEPPQTFAGLKVRTRHRAALVQLTSGSVEDGRVQIQLDDAIRAATPGQSAVLYDKTRVVGGGIIS